MVDEGFSKFFQQLYGFKPYPYQERFAENLVSDTPPNCVAVPTGAGKEATIVAGYLYQLQVARRWRRLVYSLPTRALVTQVERNTRSAIERGGLNVTVHILMGGAVERDWTEFPERPAILIGTQDQLLSRALNRGYSQSPYQWLIDFGLLSNDCLWAFDEVQLMQAGWPTSIQLQGLRDRFGTFQPSHSIWLSATLDASNLQSFDYQQPLRAIHLSSGDREHPILKPRLIAKKRLEKWSGKNEPEEIAALAIERHQPGTKTLIVVNQVPRAIAIARTLKSKGISYRLVHSRFRPHDRTTVEELQAFEGIIVATQAIEAGVDLSARLLITELCPWSSFVQRCGRCNRKGEIDDALVIWIDLPDSNSHVLPYSLEQVGECRKILQRLANADITTLEKESALLPPDSKATPIPRAADLLELFHTEEDLQGSRLDISAFVRGSEETDVFIAWREFKNEPDEERGALRREELCRVSLGAARQFLQGKTAWVWNWTKGHWEEVSRLVPGMSVLLRVSDRGYSKELGFTGQSDDLPDDLHLDLIPHDSNEGDPLSQQKHNVLLSQHSEDTANQCSELTHLLPETLHAPFIRAGRWHDYGKAHPKWQCTAGEEGEQLYAKTARWQGLGRRGLRHELASMLAARNQGESPLVQYLILCHHGKIRTTIDPWPSEHSPNNGRPYARGIWEGDRIEITVDLGGGLQVPPQTLSLAQVVSCFGEWPVDVANLLEEYGPFQLAYLEALLRVADWRASANPGGQADAT